jgi:hypothetical protein
LKRFDRKVKRRLKSFAYRTVAGLISVSHTTI